MKNIYLRTFRLRLLPKILLLGGLILAGQTSVFGQNNKFVKPSSERDTLNITDPVQSDYVELKRAADSSTGKGLINHVNKRYDYNPQLAGVGIDSLLYWDSGPDSYTDTVAVAINPTITYDTTFKACSNGAPFNIEEAVDTPSTISGGTKDITYYGPGVNSSGEFDPDLVGNAVGIYDIYVADTVTIDGNTFTDTDTTTVELVSPPNAYDLMQDTSYCQGAPDPGVELWIDGDDGIDYVLEKNGTPVDTVSGDGSGDVIFTGPYQKGTYTAYAFDGSCKKAMNNSVTVSEITTASADIVYHSPSSFCPGGSGVEIGLDTSEIGVDYILRHPSVSPVTVAGDGDSITFGYQTDSTDYYKVEATNGSCSRMLDDSIKVKKKEKPLAYDLEGTDTLCAGAPGTELYLTNSEADVDYKLYDKKNASTPVVTKSGTGDSVFFSVSDTATYYAVGVHNTSGCKTRMNNEVTFAYHPEFTVNVSKGDTAICKGSSAEIGVSNGEHWSWSPPGTLDNPGARTPVATPDSTETYKVVATDVNGCKDSAQIAVTLHGLPNANAGADLAICRDDSASLSGGGLPNGDPYESYSWSPKPTLSHPDSQYTKAGPSTSTGYELTVTNANGCQATDSVHVKVNDNPSPTVNDARICPGESATLTATDGHSFVWNTGDTGPSITKSPTDTTDYTVTAQYSTGCDAKATGTIYVKDAPTIAVDVDNSFYICSGCDTTITASATDGSSPYDYLWSNGKDTSTVTLSTTTDTSYQVTVTDNKTCKDSTTVNMYVNPTILVDSNYCASQDSFQLTVDKGSSIPDGEFVVFKGSDTLYSATEGTPEAVFDPSSQKEGDYGVKYLVSDATASYEDSVGFTVHPLPDASFTLDGVINTTDDLSYCQNRDTVTLEGVNKPGTFYSSTGTGVIGNKLIPEDLSPGDYKVYYTYTDGLGCAATDSAEVTIKNVDPAEINGLDSAYCMNTDEFTITGSPDNGSFSSGWSNTDIFEDLGSGKATFNPSEVDTAGQYTIRYKATASSGCVDSTKQKVKINALPTVWLTGISDSIEICGSADTVNLTGHPTDSNGTFLATDGLTDHGDGTATFDPSEPSPGETNLIYEYTDTTTGCMNYDTLTVTVLDTAVQYALSTVSGKSSYCANASGVELELSGGENGVLYELYKIGNVTPEDDTTLASDGGFKFDGVYQHDTYYVLATKPNGCTDSMQNSLTITEDPLPKDARPITGDDTVTLGGTGSYTVPEIDFADVYRWSKPAGVSFNTKKDSQAVEILFSESGVSPGYDTVSVYGENNCGVGAPDSFAVYILPLPDTAGPITGDSSLCDGMTGLSYSIPALDKADSIHWTAPAGFDIVSGRGTESITVDLTPTATNGYVTARGVNGSGEGPADSLYVSVNSYAEILVSDLDSVYCNSTGKQEIYADPDSGSYTSPSSWDASVFEDKGGGYADFNPSQVPNPGTHTIGYSVTVNGCTSDTAMEVTIHEVPSVTFNGLPNEICDNEDPITLTGDPADSSGKFFGSGITDHGDGTATFDPTVPSPGTYDIVYEYEDTTTGCINTATQTVEILEAPNRYTLSGGGFYCEETSGNRLSLDTSNTGIEYRLFVGQTTPLDTVTPASDGQFYFDGHYKEGTYSVFAEAPNGCTDSMQNTQNIYQKDLPDDAVTINGDDTVAVGGTGSYTTPPIPNTGTYEWILPDNATITSTADGGRTIDVSFSPSVSTGYDSVGVYGQNGCGDGGTFYYKIYVKPKPAAVDTITGDTSVCAGSDTLIYDVDPDLSAADSIEWTVPSGFTIVSGRGTQTIEVDVDSSTTKYGGDVIAKGINASGEGKADTIYVTVYPNPTIDNVLFYPDKLDCAVDSVLLVGKTSTPDSSYSWRGEGRTVDNDSVYATSPEKYTLKVTAHGCQTKKKVTVEKDTTPPTLSIDSPATITCDNPTEELQITTNTDSIVWSASSGGNIVSGAYTATPVVNTDGDYTVTVTSTSTVCSITDKVSVDADTTMDENFNINDPADITCDKDTSVISADFVSDATYSWSKNGTDENIIDGINSRFITVNDTGTYTLTVTKTRNGCSSVDSATVGLDDDPPSAVSLDKPAADGDITCDNEQVTLTASTTTSDPVSYNFYIPSGASGNLKNTSGKYATVDEGGQYAVRITRNSNGCAADDTVTVSDLRDTTFNVDISKAFDPITCSRKVDTLEVTSDLTDKTVDWSASPGGSFASGILGPKVYVDSAGTYTATVTDTTNGCVRSNSISVGEDLSAPYVGIITKTPEKITCASDVNLEAEVSGASSVSWTGPGNIDPTPDQDSVYVDAGGKYTITATAANGCSTKKTVKVDTNYDKPDRMLTETYEPISCSNKYDTLNVSSTTSNVTYQWSEVSGSGSIIADTTSPNPVVDGPGKYEIVITGDNGCTKTDTVSVGSDYRTADFSYFDADPDSLSCKNDWVELVGQSTNPNAEYKWIRTTPGSGQILRETTDTALVNETGTYELTITHSESGCTVDSTVTVYRNDKKPVAKIDQNPDQVTCSDKEVRLDGTLSTGINPQWSSINGHIISGKTDLEPLVGSDGYYVLTMEHPTSGCKDTDTVQVARDTTLPYIEMDHFSTKTLTCKQDSIQLIIDSVSVSQYGWYDENGIKLSNSEVVTVGTAGKYIFKAENTTNGCTNSKSVTIDEDKFKPIVSFSSDPLTCNTDTVRIQSRDEGPTDPAKITYNWSGVVTGDEDLSNPRVTSAGPYNVTVTSDVTGCQLTTSHTVAENYSKPSININDNPEDITCANAMVTLDDNTGQTNVSYKWTSTAGNISEPTQPKTQVDAAGWYYLKITRDDNGCSVMDSVEVQSDSTKPAVSISPVQDITCNRSEVTLEGGSPDSVSFKWEGPHFTGPQDSRVTSTDEGGDYTLVATSKVNGCPSEASVHVTEDTVNPSAPHVTPAGTCYGSKNVALTASGDSLRWYSDAGLTNLVGTGKSFTPTVSAQKTHDFYVTQTSNDNGCTSSAAPVKYEIYPLPDKPSVPDLSVCYQEPNPFIEAIPDDSQDDVYWYNSSDSLLAVSDSYRPDTSAPGTYEYRITEVDDNGCESEQEKAFFTINELPSAPTVEEDTLSVCYGASNQTFVANGTDIKWYKSAPPATPVKSGSVFTPSVSDTGTYFYYVTQANTSTGCEGPYTKVVYKILPNPQAYNVTGGGTYCEGTGGLEIGLDNSVTSTTYELRKDGNTYIPDSSGTGGALSFGQIKPEGTYTVYGTASNGCVAKMSGTASISVDSLPEAAGDITGESEVCQGATGIEYNVPEIDYADDYIWTVPDGAHIVAGQNSRTITVNYSDSAQSGMVTVKGKNSCGEGPVATGLAVDVHPLPGDAGAVSGPSGVICQGADGVAFEVNKIDHADTYVWSVPSGATIVSGAGSRSILVDFSESSTGGIVKVYGKNSCGTGATSPAYNVDVKEKPIIETTPYQSICSTSDSLIAKDPGSGSIYWELIKGQGTIASPNSFETEVTGLGNGINRFEVTLTNTSDCSDIDTVTIENNQQFVNAGADQSICMDSFKLFATQPESGVTGTWSVRQGSASFDDANQYNTMVNDLEKGVNVLRWTLTRNGCSSYDEVTIINDSPTEADAGISRQLCRDSAYLDANTPTIGGGEWSVVKGFVEFQDKTDPETKITEISRGDNILRWTITNNACTSRDTVNISNNQVNVEAGADQVLCTYRTTLNAVPPDKGEGEWSILKGSAAFEDRRSPTSEVYLGDSDTTVLAWNVSYNGCQSMDSVTVINNSPSNADAGKNQDIFKSSTYLSAKEPDKGTGKWSLLEGSGIFEDNTDPGTQVTDLAYGENMFQWKVTHEGCVSIDTVTINNMTTGSVSAGNDTIICFDQIRLDGSEPIQGEGEWTVVKGSATFDDKSQYNTYARNLSRGENVLKWTVYGNGVVSDKVTITNNSPSRANAGPDMAYCRDSVQLSANNPSVGTGSWELVAGEGSFEDSTLNNTTIKNLGTGNNTLRWTISHKNCESSDDVVITNNTPTQAEAGIDQTLCSDEATLYGNSPSVGEGLWTLVSGSNSVEFQDQTVGNTRVSNLGRGENILRWTITKENCTSSDEVTITNDNPTAPNAGRDKSICVDSFRLNANEAVIGEGKWSVISGYGDFVDTADPKTKVKNLAKGNNILRWTIKHNECILYDEVEISNDLIEADAGYDQELCQDSTSLSANNPGRGKGYWSVVTGSAVFEDASNPTTDVKELDYRNPNVLKWTISHKACVSTDKVTIENKSPGIVYAGQDNNVCDDSYYLKANPNYIGKGKWEALSGGGDIRNDSSSSTMVVNMGLGENTFRWSVNRDGCLQYDDVTIYNNLPVEAYAGENDSICNTSYTMHAEEPPFGVGRWTVVAGSGDFDEATQFNTTVSNLSQGVNTFKWTVYNGSCSTSDEVTIVVNRPNKPRAGADQEICSDSTRLQANSPGPDQKGYWEVVEGSGHFEDRNDPHTKVTHMSYGKNTYRWNISHENCNLYDEVTIMNNSPTEANAGNNIHVCGDEVRLNAEEVSIGSGEWSLVSGNAEFSDKSYSKSRVTNLGFGPNTLRWTTTNGTCTSMDEVIVYNDKAEAYAGVDQKVYKDSTTLVGNRPSRGTGKWIILGGSGTFEDPGKAQTTVRDLGKGVNTFRWTITNNGCKVSDEMSVTYYRMPNPEFDVSKDKGCPPLTVQFYNESLKLRNDFTWDFGDNNISTHENPRHTFYEPGEYTVKLKTRGPDGSTVTEDTTINVYDVPKASFDVAPEKLYIPEQHLQCYDMSIDADRYRWHFGDGSTSDEPSPKHMYQDTGTYNIRLEVWSHNNCYDDTTINDVVTVEQSGKIKFPSGFTPNPHGPVGGHYDENSRKNDVFHPIAKGVDEYTLQIFNRWGVMVFQSNKLEVGWDGYYQGKPAPEGVYIYKVHGVFNNGKRFEKVGDFVLIRK